MYYCDEIENVTPFLYDEILTGPEGMNFDIYIIPEIHTEEEKKKIKAIFYRDRDVIRFRFIKITKPIMNDFNNVDKSHVGHIMGEWLKRLNASGYAGILQPAGTIVDRRIHPEAIPIQENSMMGIVAPKEIHT